MSEIEIFNFNDHEVRVVIRDGEPWWVAKDVTNVLGFRNPHDAVKGLDVDERLVIASDSVSAGQPENELFASRSNLRQTVTLVNEPGLYSLILRSNKPEAKVFKRWVTHEVLPTIRKTGGVYVAPEAELDLSNPDVLLERFTQAVQIAKEARAEVATLKEAREADLPWLLVAEKFFDSEGLMGLRECARAFDIPQNTFAARIREWGWMDLHGTGAKAYAVRHGYMVNKVYLASGGWGQTVTGKFTRRGVQRIAERLARMAAA